MAALLEIRGLRAGYQGSQVLQGIDLDVAANEVVGLFGRNGVGKTTLVHTLTGLLRASGGTVRFDGTDITHAQPYVVSRQGIALVPQGRRVFARLTVEENLRMAMRRRPGEWTPERVYELLPRLAERRRNRGDQLSGGEQQMLAIGRALLCNPRLVVLDEPSEGLAPRLVEEVAQVLFELREYGIPALLVEQNLGMAMGLADRVAIMTKGVIAYEATVEDFRHDPETARSLLGVS